MPKRQTKDRATEVNPSAPSSNGQGLAKNDCKIGDHRPSEHIQFKKGQCGNPKPRDSDATNQEPETGQYAVGYCRPPIETRFHKGKSGNPAGRPKGRRNVNSELAEIARRKVKIRDGDKERELSLLSANFFAHAIKGAKGDSRSTALVFKLADRVGLMNAEDANCAGNLLGRERAGRVARTANSAAPSSVLFENLDIDRLSREELAELSRLAEVIDLGGDFTALSPDDFKRAKHIVNKGRGKDVTPV